MKYTTYLFDFDGTLVDSMPVFKNVCFRILEENGVNFSDEVINVITTKGYPEVAKYFAEELIFTMTADEIYKLMREYILHEYETAVLPKNNVIGTLEHLKNSGIDLNILTASRGIWVHGCMKRLGITGLFSNIWTREDVETNKYDPLTYVAAAEKLGKSPTEILFFDDNLKNLQTALSVGMNVCGVYDPHSEPQTEEIKKISDFYINDFSEIFALN